MHTSAVTCQNCRTPEQQRQMDATQDWRYACFCLHGKNRDTCLACALNRITPNDSNPVTVSPLKGWQCPVCSAVWAPFHRGCDNCKGSKP